MDIDKFNSHRDRRDILTQKIFESLIVKNKRYIMYITLPLLTMSPSDREKARRYLKQEPIKNSYQLARMEDEESTLFYREGSEEKGLIIQRDETLTLRGDKEFLLHLIDEMEFESEREYRFHAVDNESYEAVKERFDVSDHRETWMLVRDRNKIGEPTVDVEPLEKKDAEKIDKYWGSSDSDSTDYLRERIEKGPAYGVRKEGELVAWCLTHYLTEQVIMLGMIYVLDEWRRSGFAKSLTEKMCLEGLKDDLIPTVYIYKDNEPSISLAGSLGFERIGEDHWFHGEFKAV